MNISKHIVERLKNTFKQGARVELLQMNDPYTKIPIGTKGTVILVDDTGTIFVNWDNGSSLGVVYGEDSCKLI